MFRGWTLLRRGEFLQAEELLRPVIDAAAEQGVLLLVVNLLYLLPDLIAERSSQQALGTMVESVELPPAFAEAAGGGWILSARGRLRALKGQRAAAEADLRISGSIFRRLGFGPLPEPWRSHLALALPADARDEATALVEEELRIARASKLPRPQGVVLRAAGLLAERDEAIEMLRESVVVLTDSPARYEHARSLVELGAALRRSGRRSDAREPLREGSELAHRCGAERLLVRAREELLATGARPRRIARSGFDALTASERRVIRLAAEGRSNPEIAQALYLSVKTVERHLSNAYAKIELSGRGARRRLPQLVEQADRAGASAA
jgi:DNA-binding NarL/FixJ family response regulator